MDRFETDPEYRERAMSMYRGFADDAIEAFSRPDRRPGLKMHFASNRTWNERLQAALREKGYDSDLVEVGGMLCIANLRPREV